MKARTFIAVLVAGIVIGAVAAYFLLTSGSAPVAPAAAGGTFGAVTGQLDPGGSLYLFWDTAGLVKFCDQALDGIQSTIEARADDEKTREKNLKWFRLVRKLIRDTGLYRVRALGVSSRRMGEGLHHTRMVLHRDPGATSDLIWNLYAAEPHDLAELDLLPADTVIAQFGDFRPEVVWNWLHAEAENSQVAEFKKGVGMLEPMLKMKGIDPNAILGGLNGRIGLVGTLDPKRTIPVPLGGKVTPIPAPGLALVLAVKDYSLFDRLASALPGGKDLPAGKTRSLTLPAPPSPLLASPTLACNGRHLILASSRDLADALTNAGGGLRNSAEFRELSSQIPEKGNGFRYISPRLGEVLRRIQSAALDKPGMKESDRKTLQTIMGMIPTDFSMYGVVEHGKSGFRFTLNHRLGIHHLVLLPVVMTLGIGSAIAVPNMIRQVETNRCRSTIARMRSLSAAIAAHLAEHGTPPEAMETGKDGWGNPILYRRGPGTSEYGLASGGGDGRFEGWDQRGIYSCGDKGRDIILVNGQIVFGPAMD